MYVSCLTAVFVFETLVFARTWFDVDSDLQCTCTDRIYPEGLAFSRHFLKAMVHLSVSDQDPALTVRVRDLNHRFKFGGLQVSPGLRCACADVTKAPAARDVDGAAPLVTSEGCWAATWAGNLDAARAASASGLVMICHSLLFSALRRLSPSSSSSFCTAES